MVSTHSRPWAAERLQDFAGCLCLFQHTAARGRLIKELRRIAKSNAFQHTAARGRLSPRLSELSNVLGFQHTAARGRLISTSDDEDMTIKVSTHSRPWAADYNVLVANSGYGVSTHSRPWAAESS